MLRTLQPPIWRSAILVALLSGISSPSLAEDMPEICLTLEAFHGVSRAAALAYETSIHCGNYKENYSLIMLALRRAEMNCAFPDWDQERQKRTMAIFEEAYDGSQTPFFQKKFVDNGYLYGSENKDYKTKEEFCHARKLVSQRVIKIVDLILRYPNVAIQKAD